MSGKENKAPPANWTETQVLSLLTICTDEYNRFGFTDNQGFKSQSWSNIVNSFKTDNNVEYTKSQVMSKLSELKGKYKVVSRMDEGSGFGWDPLLKIPTAPDDVWDAYLKNNSDAKPYRSKRLAFYDQLHYLYGGKLATGDYASATSVSVFPHIFLHQECQLINDIISCIGSAFQYK